MVLLARKYFIQGEFLCPPPLITLVTPMRGYMASEVMVLWVVGIMVFVSDLSACSELYMYRPRAANVRGFKLSQYFQFREFRASIIRHRRWVFFCSAFYFFLSLFS